VKLEALTTQLAVVLLTSMVLVLTLAVANGVLRWDLFSLEIERIGTVVMAASWFVIIASVIVNIMLNIGRIADHFDERH